VDSPDSITAIGRLASGAEVSINVAAVPSNPGGNRLEVYGRDGVLIVRTEGSFNIGPSQVLVGKGKEPVAPVPIPAKYRVVPDGTPSGQPYNVAQAYARAAGALRDRRVFDVDFGLAVQRHTLIEAIERAAATGRSVQVAGTGGGDRGATR
jgi:predicted dehydrogenase